MKKLSSTFCSILCVATVLASVSTQADFTIKSVSKDKNLISIDIGENANVKPGNDLTAQWRDEECTLKVTQINGNTAVADGRECEFIDKLKKGDKVALSEFQHSGKYMETAPVSNPEVGRKKTTWENPDDIQGFSVQLAYNLANTLAATVNSTTTNYNAAGALALGARYASLKSYGFGFMIDASFEFPRSFNSSSSNGVTTTLSPAPTLSFITIEPNAVFRDDKLYGFAGVNVPVVVSQANWGTAGTPGGAIGFQLGAGYMITQKINAEIEYSFKNITLPGATANLYGFGLKIGYNF